jgi:type I restriction enzyme S subunit
MSVPKLRFKDDNGLDFLEWCESPLGHVASFLDEKRKPIKESDRAKIKGEFPYYGASGIIDYVNDYIFDDEIILLGEDGENIVSRNLPLAFRVSGKCWVNNHAHVIKPKEFTNIDFLVQYLDSISYLEYNTGTAQPKLNQEICKKIPVPTPSLSEQTKIANFLTAIDEKISHLTQKCELLTQYKKGVMQKIFSQELRFKDEDGREFSEWEETNIGKVLTIGSGKDYKHLSAGEIPVYGTGGYMLSVDNFLYDGESVCIGRKGTIDKPVLLSGKFWTVDTLFYTHSFKNCIPKFIYAYFQTIDWKNHNEASGVPSLSKSTIEKIAIQIPCVAEQTKIANFLTAIDDKITNAQTQLTAVKQYKQGLLQQMFV